MRLCEQLLAVPAHQRFSWLKEHHGIGTKTAEKVIAWAEQSKYEPPFLHVLSFSAGTGSCCILWQQIRDEYPRPRRFLVVAADPGMENALTYAYRDMMFNECAKVGIECHVAPGPNLHKDLVTLKARGKTRVDNPPFYTLSDKGSVGQLKHGCTKHYKIAPMDRFVRHWLWKKHWVRKGEKLRQGFVEKWIGFTADEVSRIKPAQQTYNRFGYPLIDSGIRKVDFPEWYASRGLKMPPRSVCNACFGNSPKFYALMKRDRPEDFQQAKEIDESIRDWSFVGTRDAVYLHSCCKPIGEMAEMDLSGDDDEQSCDGGYCFI